MSRGLVCFDMDGVLVDHLSTWEWVYNKLGLSNHEAYAAFQAGEINEWEWIKYDLELIRGSLGPGMNDAALVALLEDCPLMLNWRQSIQCLLDAGFEVAIISGGMQPVARRIAAAFPSSRPWRQRWGGLDRATAMSDLDGADSRIRVFTNGWLPDAAGSTPPVGRYQVQMIAKGALVEILQRRLGIAVDRTTAIGDSRQDASMFSAAGLSIAFNARHGELIAAADVHVLEKDLMLVSEAILDKIPRV